MKTTANMMILMMIDNDKLASHSIRLGDDASL